MTPFQSPPTSLSSPSRSGGDRATLPAATPDELKLFRFARATLLDNLLLGFLFRVYRSAYARLVAADDAAFDASVASAPPFAEKPDEKNVRVRTAIRRVASFGAWYPVAGAVFRAGLRLSAVAGAASAAAMTVWFWQLDGNTARAGIALLIGLAAIGAAALAARRLPRAPYDILTCVVVLGVLTLIVRLPAIVSAAWAIEIVVVAGLIGYVAVLLIVLGVVRGMRAWVTKAKLVTYPEDEIIESLIAVSGKLGAIHSSWVSGRDRAKIIDDLDWIADRFENDLLVRFRRGDATTDAWLQDAGARLAAACRMHARAIALPEAGGYARVLEYVRGALFLAVNGEWSAIEQIDAPPTSPRLRLAGISLGTAQVIAPGLAGFVVWRIGIGPPELLQNAFVTGMLASVVALWSSIDPKGVEQTKTISELLHPAK